MDLPKYPRTFHIEGSKGIEESEAIPFSELQGKPLVIEEKMDGSMVSICFDNSGTLHIRHRNQEVRGTEFDLMKSWVAKRLDQLFDLLEDRYVMYGEWLFARHTITYNLLPDYFLEFDIFDRQENHFLSTVRRKQILQGQPIHSVHVLDNWRYRRKSDVVQWAEGPSAFGMGHKEGLYIKIEDDGVVQRRYKYIRKEFTDAIQKAGKHWSELPFVQNQLKT